MLVVVLLHVSADVGAVYYISDCFAVMNKKEYTFYLAMSCSWQNGNVSGNTNLVFSFINVLIQDLLLYD